MRGSHSAVLLIGTLAAACAGNPAPATAPQPAPPAAAPAPPPPPPAPAPTAAADLSGSWAMSVDAGGQTIPVDVTLTRGPNGYTGEALPAGQTAANLTSLSIQGDRVTMVFSAPDGEATFNGTLSADRRSMAGTLAYNGQSLPFTMAKR